VPGASDTAMIERGFTVTVDIDNAKCTTLDLGSINSGNGAGTIAFNSGSQLTVIGSLFVGVDSTRTGSINMANGGTLISTCLICNSLGTWTPGTGTVQLTYGNTLPSKGITTFNNLTIASGTTTVGANLTINGNLKIANGAAFTAGPYALTVEGTTTVGDGASGTLTISSATGTKTFTGPVTINPGGALTQSAPATLSFGGDVTIGGTLMEDGAALVGLAGNLQNNGTYTASTGLHTFSGATKTLSGTSAITIPSVAVAGTCQNNGTLAVTNALSGAGGLTQGPNSRLLIGGPTTTAITIATLNASANVNTVIYTGDAQTVKPTPYYNLTLSGNGTKTMTGATVSGTLDFEGTASAAFTDTPTAGSLAFLGVTQPAGTWGNTGSGATHLDPAHFTGPGVLNVGSTPTSITTLASSPNPSTYDTPVTFTATVTGFGSTPAGTVTFNEGAAPLGSTTLDASGVATLVISTLSVAASPHTITAVYGGDGNHPGSTSSPVTQTVNHANPIITAWPTPSPITYGQTLADSTLTGGSATPGGTFTFTSPSTAPNAGTAPQSVTFTPADPANYNPATGAVPLQVLPRLTGSLTGAVLPGYKGPTIKVRFVARDADRQALSTNDVELATADGGSTFNFALGVPSNTATLSLKPRFFLCKQFPIPATIATANQVPLDPITWTFLGGDADGNNQVDGNDYAWIRLLWRQIANPQYDLNGDGKTDADDFPDLNGDGVIDAKDYALLKSGWYQQGDPE